jgi:hypothetical protein
MGYNAKQYDAAKPFMSGGDDNIVDPQDILRIKAYDLYENIYINSADKLSLVLRGDDQCPVLLPTGRKYVEACNRFLGVNVDYFVEGQGDAGLQDALDAWFKDFFKREEFKVKFESSKRWGLTRGDSILYIYANPLKAQGDRISICEVDPRQVFEIEDIEGSTAGYHIVDKVRDWREKDNRANKLVARRRTFRKAIDPNSGLVVKDSPITTELTYWEIGKWDDRSEENELKQIVGGPEEQEQMLMGSPESPITSFPLYQWPNKPMQNTSWGTSELAGMETLLYALNQSLTDEDVTVVFQGLGMWVTTASAPIDPNTGSYGDWNVGPMQIIEIGETQKFERVTGVTDVSPYQDHMNFMDEKGLSEGSGIPEIAIGRIDVQTAESGISLKLQFMPLLAANAEKELKLIVILDQLFHDLVTQWLAAFEPETFGDPVAMQEMSVVCLFDDPMPTDRDAEIQETVLLVENNLILTSMAVGKLRSLGWKYPTVGPNGETLTDDDIAQMLQDQMAANASAVDPFANAGADMSAFANAAGLPELPANIPTNGQPKKKTIPMAGS